MLKFKKVFIVLFSTLLILLFLVNNVQAADGQIVVIGPGNSTSTPTPAAPSIETPAPAQPTPTPVINTPTPAPVLPQTGIEDYTWLIVVVAILATSSLFAFKRMKDLK